jgi:hypothetical protein
MRHVAAFYLKVDGVSGCFFLRVRPFYGGFLSHLFLHHPSPKIIGNDTADPRHRSISLEAGPSCAVV